MAGRKRKYKVNEDFFSRPLSPEAAYVMGFFLADGYYHVSLVHGKYPAYSIGFSLHERDAALLEKIRGVMCSEHPISFRMAGGYSTYRQASLHIHSKKLTLSLLEDWKIPRQKSKEARLPKVSAGVRNHLVRGYFDGDGSIGLYTHKRGSRNRAFSFCGGPIILDIAETIENDVFIRKVPRFRERPSGSAYELAYGTRDAEILVWLYKGATIYLSRKHQIAMQFLRETNPGA